MMGSGTPALPPLIVSQWMAPLSWAVVLAWCGMVVWQRSGRQGRVGQRVLMALLAASVALPGAWSSAYWLGLAFRFPSLLTVLLCGLGLVHDLCPDPSAAPAELSLRWRLCLAGAGVLAGWLLLLDLFAVLPLPLYAWGFGPLLPGMLMALSLVLWVLAGRLPGLAGPVPGLLVLVLLLFACTRMPDGNVWPALLDPCLWVVLHGVLLRSLLRRTSA